MKSPPRRPLELSFCLALGLFALMTSGIAAAQTTAQTTAQSTGRTPMLMEGKTTLYQRVLTRPGAQLLAQPGGAVLSELPALSIFYVYDRLSNEAGTPYVEVGGNTAGQVKGWVAANDTIEWKQSLVLSFAEPAGREPVLFFSDEYAMLDLVESEDLGERLQAVRAEAEATGTSPDDAVIAREPDTYVDIREQFYLLPILQAREIALASGFRAKSVEVASVTAEKEAPQPLESQRANPELADFSAALVFVIDASTSMGPYIDEAREAVAGVYKRIEEAGLADKMRFGLIGYRDDPDAVPGVDYLSRVFVEPREVADDTGFLQRAAALEASKVSTRTFEEDGFAGLIEAVDGVDWSSFGGRYIVFITDASSRDAGHRFSSTGLGAAEVREKALEKHIATYTLHLKTPESVQDHAAAERQYALLSDYPNVGSLYYPVDAGDVSLFRAKVDALAQAIVDQVAAASKGEFAAGSRKVEKPAPSAPTAEADLEAKTAALGYAMQLVYLGRVQGTKAPPLLRAWSIDRDLDDPAKQALKVRVLLTKAQLSDLQAALREIVEVGIATETSRETFFDQLKSATAALSRDPTQVGRQGATNLQELGILGEYLDDLPYRSRVLALSEETWNRWSIGEQVAFIDDLSAKIRLYQRFHDDVDNWVSLDDGAAPADAVYPIPLSALP